MKLLAVIYFIVGIIAVVWVGTLFENKDTTLLFSIIGGGLVGYSTSMLWTDL